MPTMTTQRGPELARKAKRELVVGWVSAGIAVVTVVGMFQVSDLFQASVTPSWMWVFLPALFLASTGAAWFGLAARRHGEEGGPWPAVVGLVIGGFFLVMLLLAFVGHLIGFE